MKKRNCYNRNNIITAQEKLPVGGYVAKILNAKEENFEWGDRLAIAFDIVEGEYAGFFDKNFKNQQSEDKKWKGTIRINIPKEDGSEKDEWTQKRFNTNMVAIEESNPGFYFDWDETKLKGKMVGIIFNNKEYEFNGNHGFFTNPHSFASVEDIRSGNFKIPKDTLLSNPRSSAPAVPTGNEGFMSVPEGVDEEIPF